jgi:hypothetical protein
MSQEPQRKRVGIVVMGSILIKCKKLKKLYGPSLEYWQLGQYCPGLQGLIGFIIIYQPRGEVIANLNWGSRERSFLAQC